MDPKKALMKGLQSISKDEFLEAAKLIAKEGVKENRSSYDDDKKLREKYPAYDQASQMMMDTMRSKPDEKVLLHSIGVLSTFKILINLAERKQ